MELQLELGSDNTILNSVSSEVDLQSPGFDIESFVQNMIDTMNIKKGIGIAAPQVGELKRIIVIHPDKNKDPLVMINPEITFFSKQIDVQLEGCLSLPGEEYKIERPKKIRYKYYDLSGNKITGKAKGLFSRVIQHEVDHLDGVLISEKAV